MAVALGLWPAVRALLSAQLQASWNRSEKELGEVGRVMVPLFIGLVVVLLLIPLGAGSLGMGYLIGRKGPQQEGLRLVLSGTFSAIALLVGIIGGITGGSRVLAWQLRQFVPTKPKTSVPPPKDA